MSVWPNLPSSSSPLCGSEGALVAVSVTVEPCDLEAVLDALAQLDFPINPQIYHEALSVFRYADGHEESEPTTIVQFPAYEGRLPEIRCMLEARGFRPDSLHVADILDEIRRDAWSDPAPPGAAYRSCLVRKYATRARAVA